MHLPVAALPGALPLLNDPAGQAIAGRSFAPRSAGWYGNSYIIQQLGYTPANKAGDTFTGTVLAPLFSGPLQAGSNSTMASSGGLTLKAGIITAAPNNSTDCYIGPGNGIGLAGDLLLFPRSSTGVANAIRMYSGQTNPVEALQITSAGQVAAQKLGAGFGVKEGANAKMGTAVLVAGTVVVNTTAVTANSRIFLCGNADGGAPGWLRVSARTAGTSFTITSSSATDTSTVAWIIFEPS